MIKWIGIGFLILVSITILSLLGRACGYIGKATDVVMQEVDPQYLLKKYEWFKDASATLDKKIADIQVYEVRVKELEKSYQGDKRNKWAREDREQHSLWLSELAGVTASYNQLASEYNSQMSKINWAFTNVGQLPQGADKVLQREYKSYIGGVR